jgi:transmembrane sensor
MTEPGSNDEFGLLPEAAAWFARMRGPDAEASRPEFEAWLARGALHRAAYNRASEIFAMGKLLSEDDAPTAAPNAPTSGRSRRVAFAAAAALLAVVASMGLLTIRTLFPAHPDSGTPDRSAPIQVAVLGAAGEARSVRLADGSLVRLAAESILDVSFTRNERRSRLERGLALFEVAHEKRPFIVAAGGGIVTAHGTVFEVGLSPDRRVSVRLIEGVIDVKLPAANRAQHGAVKRLHGSGALTFAAGSGNAADAQAMPRSPAVEQMVPAQEARDFDGIRLADLLSIANRRFSRPIRLADPALGQEPISGRFRTDNPDLLSERIALLLGLTVDRSDPAAIVLRRK